MKIKSNLLARLELVVTQQSCLFQMEGQPQMINGALPKADFVKKINEILKVE